MPKYTYQGATKHGNAAVLSNNLRLREQAFETLIAILYKLNSTKEEHNPVSINSKRTRTECGYTPAAACLACMQRPALK